MTTDTVAAPQAARETIPATRLLADWVSGLDDSQVTAPALEWAKHVLLDWLAVTIAGAGEPLVKMLADEYGTPGVASLPCTLLGGMGRARPLDAALINGSAGHALDFDDVASRMYGHPTVPVAPAALALAQARRLSGRDLLRALVVGHEVESRVGEMVGPGHYEHGFHATGTVGTFGAAAACATLLRLDAGATAQALGLAAAQAAGLKCMFGTMAKPLHAGKAAMNGLMAAQLAARGFTAHDAAIECPQGFARTQSPRGNGFVAPIDLRAGFAIQSTLFKYHASCYLTHSTIEAVRLLRERHGATLDGMATMTIDVAGNHRGVCDIAEPRTGLNIKFAIQQLAAMALDGADTARLDLYTDAAANNPRHVEARRRVALQVGTGASRNAATVTILTRDGRRLSEEFDVAIPATDLALQWRRLSGKARAIAAPVIGQARFDQLLSAIRGLDSAPTLAAIEEAVS